VKSKVFLIRGIIFDLDGTLLDSAPDLCSSINHARKYFGLSSLPMPLITSYVGSGINNLIRLSFEGSDISVEKAKPIVADHYEEHCLDTSKPYPGVLETLPQIIQKKCIVTNKPEAFVPPMLKAFGMNDYFDFIIGGDTFIERKPHPSVGYLAIGKLNLSPDQIIVVGDHHADIELANNCGMKSVFCTYGIGSAGGLQATYTITKFNELMDILK
jgi:phosphoglycolate phosphatase